MAAILLPSIGAARPSCTDYPSPVIQLDYGSPYRADSEYRNVLDDTQSEQVRAALKQTDDYIRFLAGTASEISRQKARSTPSLPLAEILHGCLRDGLLEWASAGAFGHLASFESNLTFGSRLAGISIAYREIRPEIEDATTRLVIDSWLKSMAWRQVLFWETRATAGARQGNLRAWAALSSVVVGLTVGDEDLVTLGADDSVFILCTALADGSLPQEMTRGKYALHYQNHAVSALVSTAAYLQHMGPELQGRRVLNSCNGALTRVVNFTLLDLQTGSWSQFHSGKVQNFFDGSAQIQSFMLAWLIPLGTLNISGEIPLNDMVPESAYNSKLGGNQRFIWKAFQNDDE